MKKIFTTKTVAGIAVFSALSFIVYLLEIPIFSGTPASFLELDLSNVFVLLAGFMYGPIGSVIVTIVKESIHIAVGSTGGVGELANVIITLFYVLIPSIVYLYKKGFKVVVISLIGACAVQVSISLIVNRYINFPFFMGSVPFAPNAVSESAFKQLFGYIIAFNAIKSVAISGITLIIYKKISALFKKINLQN